MNFIFQWLKKEKINYLDIGANDPKKFNNTYFFYRKNNRGVLVEPDLRLLKKIKRVRPRDRVVNSGVGVGGDSEMTFYLMDPDTLSTTASDKADEYVAMGVKLKEKRVVPLVNINDLILQEFPNEKLDFLSIDVEGLDLEIVKSINFEFCRPIVICAETLTFTTNNSEFKIDEISKYLIGKGYFIYADTYLNTIFVDEEVWKSRV